MTKLYPTKHNGGEWFPAIHLQSLFLMTTSPPKPGFKLWVPVILLFLGMSGGAGLTLWAVRQFGVGETARPQAGQASPVPRSEPGMGVPGSIPQATAIATKLSQDGQFRFDLQNCRRSDGNVMCELQITNLTDQEILVHLSGGKTLAYTDNGLEFRAVNLVLGSRSDYFYAAQTLVAKIPTPASFQFREMPPTSKLSLLKIGYRYRSLETGQWVDDTIEFRPVPIIAN